MVFPTFFNLSLNLAIRSSWSEAQSVPGLVFADCIDLHHFGCKEYNQSDFSVDHLVMSMCSVFSCVVGRGCLLWQLSNTFGAESGLGCYPLACQIHAEVSQPAKHFFVFFAFNQPINFMFQVCASVIPSFHLEMKQKLGNTENQIHKDRPLRSLSPSLIF